MMPTSTSEKSCPFAIICVPTRNAFLVLFIFINNFSKDPFFLVESKSSLIIGTSGNCSSRKDSIFCVPTPGEVNFVLSHSGQLFGTPYEVSHL